MEVYYDQLDAEHYWTKFDGGSDVHSDNDPDFDRKNEVFDAILYNNGFAIVT